ncbi:MAG TPA: DNA repair protein RecO [Actinomycetota bacterium]|nr:DNA repair protein RecO [Actinomycetota bacterium]
MPLYREQGIVLGSVKLAEADKIVTILTQGSGKVRAVAKGIRRTQSRFGARLEPFTHVDLLLYRGRNLDTVTQADILHPFRGLREDFSLFSAGETMLEAVDKVAEEHERNVRLFLLLKQGLEALETRPADPAAVAESFLLRLLNLSGFAPSLTACAVCGRTPVARFSASQGGAVCDECRDRDARRASPEALEWLAGLLTVDLAAAGEAAPPGPVRGEARALLYAFAEYHIERRIRSLPLLAAGSRNDQIPLGR